MEHRGKYTTPKGTPIWRAIGLWPGAHPVTMGFVLGQSENASLIPGPCYMASSSKLEITGLLTEKAMKLDPPPRYDDVYFDFVERMNAEERWTMPYRLSPALPIGWITPEVEIEIKRWNLWCRLLGRLDRRIAYTALIGRTS